jgi:uncharacterized protein YjiS (DUF1127 family)
MDKARTMVPTGRGVLAAPVVGAMLQIAEWNRRRQIRNAFGLTSDVLLRDIGLTQDDLTDALAQPLDRRASDALIEAAVARAANW